MAPSSKRAKLSHPLPFSDGLFDRENVDRMGREYSNGKPFKHAVINKLFQDGLLRDVKRECQKLAFTKKETDIYKVSTIILHQIATLTEKRRFYKQVTWRRSHSNHPILFRSFNPSYLFATRFIPMNSARTFEKLPDVDHYQDRSKIWR